jgi:pimeloyl-ACP methyl ester carboxylesterase
MTQVDTPTVKYATLASGVRLPYVEQGDSDGVPVVLLHGVTDSLRSWEPVLPHLPSSIRAFAVTQRGHGDADRPAAGYHPRDFAADVVAFLDAVGIERAVIAGHSMSSYIAQRVATEHPERVLGVVLVGAFATYSDNPVVVELCEAVEAFGDSVDPEFVVEFQESTIAQPVAEGFVDMVVSESLKLPAPVWQATFAGLLEIDRSVELESIAAPTLVVWGDQDVAAPRADQDALAEGVPGAELLVYEGAGHALHWEEPQRFAADLIAFVEDRVG